MTKMSLELRAECLEVILDCTGLKLPHLDFVRLKRKNPALEEMLIKYESPSDTCDREALMSAVAIDITGRDWPTFGLGQQTYEKFIADFEAKAKARGFVFLKDDDAEH